MTNEVELKWTNGTGNGHAFECIGTIESIVNKIYGEINALFGVGNSVSKALHVPKIFRMVFDWFLFIFGDAIKSH